MAERSIIIIGAGLAGLAAGVHAQHNGYRAHIFEHAGGPGGVAVGWRRGAYFVDGGIHFLMGHKPDQPLHRVYAELGTGQPEMCVDMHTYGRYVDQRTGRSLTITADLDRLIADWRSLSPEDVQPMEELVRVARAFADANAFDLGMGDPPELAGRLAGLGQLWGMRSVLRYFTGPYARTMLDRAQAIGDPWLREVYANLFYPQSPVWFVGMVLGLLTTGGMGLLRQGSTGFVQPIERCLVELGGQITYGATVEQILVAGGRAAGVRLANGEEHRADAVISAADGRSTLWDMLEGRYLDRKTAERYEAWSLVPPMMMVSFGVARTFAGEPHLYAFSLAEPFDVGPQRVGTMALRTFNYSDAFAPEGKTVIQATFDSDWDYWRDLRDDPAVYEAEKRRVAAAVLARLEAYYPGLSGQVEMTDVATPFTTWRYTRNHRGAYMGWLPTPQQMMSTLPRTLPGLDRFVMAGQWVMPGGGVPTCLLSGRDAVRILCAQDGVKFRAV